MERVKPVHLKTSDRGLELITDFEDKILYAYDDKDTSRPRKHIMPGDPIRGTLTIGSGHTRTVKPGDVITEADRLSLLRSDVREAESFVHRFVDVPLSQSEFDGLVSLLFQQGPGRKAGTLGPEDEGDDGIIWLKSGKPSTLLSELNKGNYEVAAECFTSWRAPRSAWELGLTRRRVCEMLHFQGLPWKRALNAINSLPVVLKELIHIAQEEQEDAEALVLRAPAPKPAPTVTAPTTTSATSPTVSATISSGGGKPAQSDNQASAGNPEPVEAVRPGPVAAQPPGPAPAKVEASAPVVVPQPGQPGNKPIDPDTKRAEEVPYGVDPRAGAKPMEKTERFLGAALMLFATGLRSVMSKARWAAGAGGTAATTFLALFDNPETRALIIGVLVWIVGLFVIATVGVWSAGALNKRGLKIKKRGETTARQLMW